MLDVSESLLRFLFVSRLLSVSLLLVQAVYDRVQRLRSFDQIASPAQSVFDATSVAICNPANFRKPAEN